MKYYVMEFLVIMKKTYYFYLEPVVFHYLPLFIIIVFLNISHLDAQVQYGGKPVSFMKGLPCSDVETVTVSLTEENEQIRYNYDIELEPGVAMHAGFSLSANINPGNSGTWEFFGDSLQLWRVKIHSPGALALGLVFDEFELSDNTRIYIYSEDRQFALGAFDHRNNNNESVFTTHIIPSETIVIEYEAQFDKVVFAGELQKAPFNISEVIYVSNGGGLFSESGKGLGSSDFCQININCPEGDQWQKQKRSVARMLMKVGDNYYWCSGALVNNTAQDGKPYFLSAAHCGAGATHHDLVYWHFYFNFERPGCVDEGTPPYNMIHGCDLISRGPLEGGSDFRLLLLREQPPSSWKPYYSGWSRSTSPSGSGVGIHHPSGDVKKISTYSEVLTSATPNVSGSQMAENSAWRVEWDSTITHWGVPQGGSSGSPLFNSQGLVVGTLTGGSSSCASPQHPDYYGKVSYHWVSNDPDDQHKQLKPYLDPERTGAITLQGYDPYFSEYPAPGFLTAKKTNTESIELLWYKPGSTPNKAGWHSYVTNYSHLTWELPERAVLFDDKELDFSFPVILRRVSHYFVEHSDHTWPDDKFRFRIYGSEGISLLYESEQLSANHMQEMVYQLEEPLVLEDKFYVSVRPVHSSGHPSTLMLSVNYGAGHSFAGSSDNWSPYVDIANSQEFDFLTKIYIAENKSAFTEKKVQSSGIPVQNYPGDNNLEHESLSLNDSYRLFSGKNVGAPVYYRVYRDDEMIHQTATSEETTYVEEDVEYGFYRYHVTAVYEGAIESEPSNKANILNREPCTDFIGQYPFKEVFEGGELSDCWEIENESSISWQFSTGYSIDNTVVDPVEGSHFIYVPWTDEENQDEWLITAPFDLSAIIRPALRFWFNGSYTWSEIEDKCRLKVYVSIDDGAFHKIWDHSMHPEFNSSNSDYLWFQALVNLREFYGSDNLRIAFQYEGKDGANFAVDKIEIIDASGSLSTVTLSVEPNFSGMVTGGGSYLEGEPVTIKAEPNIEYSFVNWEEDGAIFSQERIYSFIMPSDNLDIIASFSSVLSVDDSDLPSGLLVGFPNPAKSKYNIIFNKSMTNVNIGVYNLQGKMLALYDYEFIESGEHITLNLYGLLAGIYLVNVNSDDYRKALKINIIE